LKLFLEVATQDFEPPPSYGPEPTDPEQRRKYREAIELGERLISPGKVAAPTAAGGQGTRLSFDGPKGNFPVYFAENLWTVALVNFWPGSRMVEGKLGLLGESG
jgi:UDP-N-acetylglucosamine pyrophosphorylase